MRLLVLLCLLIPFQTMATTSLWRVTKDGTQLFIGGTVHLLSVKDYPLPNEFTQAYNKAQMLVFETDLTGMDNVAGQVSLMENMQYNEGESLKTVLRPATYHALENYLKTINLPIASIEQLKPSMVMLTLTLTELQRLEMGESGVDLYFAQKALTDGKKLGQLETVEKQMQVLENMSNGHEDDLILNTLDELKNLPTMMRDLKSAWRSGDLGKMEQTGITPMRQNYPALYQIVLVERNNSWMPKIEALLRTPEIELVLVGSLHLAGQEGLLAQLRRRGYKVEPF